MYSLDNNFDDNIPQNVTAQKLKLKEDQKVSLAVIEPQKRTQLFRFFDFFHSGKVYYRAYKEAGFHLIQTHKPIGQDGDEIPWISERAFSPYKIHILYPDDMLRSELTMKSCS